MDFFNIGGVLCDFDGFVFLNLVFFNLFQRFCCVFLGFFDFLGISKVFCFFSNRHF